MKRNVLVMLIAVVLTGAAMYQNFASANQPLEQAPKPNYLSPAFTLSALDQKTYKVDGPRGKPLLINFWASWCGPCEVEAPYLKTLFEKYHKEIDFYAVNVTHQDKLSNVRQFVETYGFTFPILLDKEGDVARLYRIHAIPTSFLVDRNGVIQEVFNLVSPDELERKIKNVIDK